MVATAIVFSYLFIFICLLDIMRCYETVQHSLDVYDTNHYFLYLLAMLALHFLVSPFGHKTSQLLNYVCGT